MIENTKETQRSICASYAKDTINQMIESKVFTPLPNLTELENVINDIGDLYYNWVMKDQLKDMSDAQLTKIESLMRLVKPEPDHDRIIRGGHATRNVKEAGELIEELMKMLPPLEYQDYMNTQGQRKQATANSSQRDPN